MRILLWLLGFTSASSAAGSPSIRGAASRAGGLSRGILLLGSVRQPRAVHDVGVQHLQQQVVQRHNVLHFHAVEVVHAFVTTHLKRKWSFCGTAGSKMTYENSTSVTMFHISRVLCDFVKRIYLIKFQISIINVSSENPIHKHLIIVVTDNVAGMTDVLFTWDAGCVRATWAGGRGGCTVGGRWGRFCRWPTPEHPSQRPEDAATWSDSAAPRCPLWSSGTCLVTHRQKYNGTLQGKSCFFSLSNILPLQPWTGDKSCNLWNKAMKCF